MLGWLARRTVAAAALAVVVAIACCVGRFGPAVRHALWLIVLIKLLMPPIYQWPVPFWPNWDRILSARTAVPRRSLEEQRQQGQPTLQSGQPPASLVPSSGARSVDATVPNSQPHLNGTESNAGLERSRAVPGWHAPTWTDYLLIFWIAGSAVVFLVHGLRGRRFRRLLLWRQAAPPRLVGHVRPPAAMLLVRTPRPSSVPRHTTPCRRAPR